MKSLAYTLLLLSSTLTITTLHADTLRIPVGEQNSTQASPLPQRGATFDAVRRGWGEPVTRHAAIGQPPGARGPRRGTHVVMAV